MWIVAKRENGVEKYWIGYLWSTNRSIAKKYNDYQSAQSIADDLDGYVESAY